jgi:hypothetical protein
LSWANLSQCCNFCAGDKYVDAEHITQCIPVGSIVPDTWPDTLASWRGIYEPIIEPS